MLPPMGDTVRYDVEGAVATLTLNRPDRLNAIVPELIDDLEAALDRAQADKAVRAMRLRGAGRVFCAGYDIGWGAEMMAEAEGDRPWDPIADYQTMTRYVSAYMRFVALAQARHRAGPRLLRRRRHRLRAVQRPDRLRRGRPDRLSARPGVGLADHLDVGLPARPRARQAAAAHRRPARRAHGGRMGLASEAVPAEELDEAAMALAQRVARLPANQLHMMKLLVNQAYEQMGLSVTQLIGTLLDGAARHTPEGVAFSQAAMEDIGRAVADRDAPFGDYGQRPR